MIRRPSKVTSPREGVSNPVAQLRKVLLPAPGADDGVNLTRSQFNRHAIKRLEVAELFGQIACCKDGLGVHDRLPEAERQF